MKSSYENCGFLDLYCIELYCLNSRHQPFTFSKVIPFQRSTRKAIKSSSDTTRNAFTTRTSLYRFFFCCSFAKYPCLLSLVLMAGRPYLLPRSPSTAMTEVLPFAGDIPLRDSLFPVWMWDYCFLTRV